MCGIPDEKLVEAHGSFATASCHLCYTPYPAEEAKVRMPLYMIYESHALDAMLIFPACFLSNSVR